MTKDSNVKYAVLTDFDGTVTTFDIAHYLVKYFKVYSVPCKPVHKCENDAKAWMQYFLGEIKTTPEEFEKVILSAAKPRDGFLEMVETCFKKNIPFEVVSGGLDIYINPILKKFKVTGVPVYSANAKITPEGIKVEYPLLEGYSLDGFKAMRVNHYKNLGYKVIFCGDGDTDYTAALTADAAFATDALLAKCDANNIPVNVLDSYKGVTKLIK